MRRFDMIGIGVTPFRSMVQELLDKRTPRPIVMLYGNNTAGEIAYAVLFDRAERELRIRTVYAVADGPPPDRDNVHQRFIDAALIEREVLDYNDRTFYISGPRAMVVTFQSLLGDLGVARSRIKVDYFPGFA
jgi:glycine betaine catabolism B